MVTRKLRSYNRTQSKRRRVCVCVCVCVCARVRACVSVCIGLLLIYFGDLHKKVSKQIASQGIPDTQGNIEKMNQSTKVQRVSHSVVSDSLQPQEL